MGGQQRPENEKGWICLQTVEEKVMWRGAKRELHRIFERNMTSHVSTVEEKPVDFF